MGNFDVLGGVAQAHRAFFLLIRADGLATQLFGPAGQPMVAAVTNGAENRT
jgi:hypothetical protein